MQPEEEIIAMKYQTKPWKVIGADLFPINNSNFFHVVEYHSKFPIVKRAEKISADSLSTCGNVLLAEYGLPKKIISDEGTNFISGNFKEFCKKLNIEQVM